VGPWIVKRCATVTIAISYRNYDLTVAHLLTVELIEITLISNK